MQARATVIIPEKDFKKIMKNAGVKTVRQLSIKANMDYTYLNKFVNDKVIMSEQSWNLLKIYL